ncbi:crosslink repair DNA glycosylase YcaQ family protein [Pseudonocardia ailaonensis]|uniref:Crosslink repair DNA glycosylase YcaQ family protein n=1 Tax=Pseudonocardia ailaonensis TaxID=367279 RepID=A0ABN2MNU3_9PSEU
MSAMAGSAAPILHRGRVLAWRAAALGLAARAGGLADLAVLRLGIQDSPPGSLRVALAARLEEPPADPGAGYAVVWSHRGAPHLHPAGDLPALATACWPASEADAAARLGWQRARLAEVGMASRRAIRTVAEAVGQVLAGGPRVKGELSAEITAIVPAPLSPYCRPCGTHHVAEQLLRLAGLPGGARLRPGTKPVVAEAVEGWAGPPEEGDPAPVVAAYLEFFGPAAAGDLASFVGTSVTALRPALPDDLVEVTVDGRAALCPPGLVDALSAAPEPAGVVRLVPPSDPFLQARDRETLVPDPARRKEVWRSIGPPGAVLVDGEVAGTWRTQQRGKTLEITVDAFRALTGAERGAVGEEAERIGAVRGAGSVRVRDGEP